MAYIMNALDESVSTQAHGKWFSWKPQEIKMLHNEQLARFLSQNRGEEGLVEVPESLMEIDKNSEEFKTKIYEIRKSGIMKFVAKQNSIVRNLEISLRRDYETSGQKGNFLFEASKGELEAYKKLKKYKEFEAKEQINVADEIQKIRQELYGEGSGGRPSPTESAAQVEPLKRN
jgi:hypothetical protein